MDTTPTRFPESNDIIHQESPPKKTNLSFSDPEIKISAKKVLDPAHEASPRRRKIIHRPSKRKVIPPSNVDRFSGPISTSLKYFPKSIGEAIAILDALNKETPKDYAKKQQLNQYKAELILLIQSDPLSDGVMATAIKGWYSAAVAFASEYVSPDNQDALILSLDNDLEVIMDRSSSNEITKHWNKQDGSIITFSREAFANTIKKHKANDSNKDVKSAISDTHLTFLNSQSLPAQYQSTFNAYFGSQSIQVTSTIETTKTMGLTLPNKIGHISSHSIIQTQYARNLIHTLLQAEGNRKIFEAIRHGVICAYGISDPDQRMFANTNAGKNVLQAIILKDYKLKQAALNQKPGYKYLEFPVLSINLQTPSRAIDILEDWLPFIEKAKDEKEHVEEQLKAWEILSSSEQLINIPIDISAHGATMKVSKETRVKPDVHMVNYGVNIASLKSKGVVGWATSDPINKETLQWLLGSGFEKISEGKDKYPILGIVGSFLENNQEHPKKDIMHQLIQQIIKIHNSGSYKKQGHEPYKILVRLAYLAFLCDIKVLWNCKSNKDRSGFMDAEVKFFVSRVEAEGEVPPIGDPLSEDLQATLRKFTLLAGNHQVQQWNTSIPGYKSDNPETIKRNGGNDAAPIIFGASKHVPC